MKTIKTNAATVRMHGDYDKEKLKEATEAFVKKAKKGKKNERI